MPTMNAPITEDEQIEHLRQAIEISPTAKDRRKLAAILEDRKKANTRLEYERSDRTTWWEINHVLKGRQDNPPDPASLKKLKESILEAKLIFVYGKSGSGKSSSAIIAADHLEREKRELRSVQILSLLTARALHEIHGEETFAQAAKKEILIIDGLNFGPFTPLTLERINALLSSRESCPTVGPTIILSALDINGLVEHVFNHSKNISDQIAMRLLRAKQIAMKSPE